MKAGGQELFERLRASGRYGDLCPDALLRIAEECAGKYRRLKDAEGAARTALHGVTGSFMTRADEQRFLRALGTMGQCPDDRALEELLSCHASTRERLPLGEARALAERLLEKTGMRATLSGTAKKGQIILQYGSLDELNRLSEILDRIG